MVAAEGKNCLQPSSAHDRVPLLLPSVKCPKLRLRIRGLDGGDCLHHLGAQPTTAPSEKIHLTSKHHTPSTGSPKGLTSQQTTSTSASHNSLAQQLTSGGRKMSHTHHHHTITLRSARLASAARPLSTYTSLGSRRSTTLPTRARSKSMGNYPETATTASPTSSTGASSWEAARPSPRRGSSSSHSPPHSATSDHPSSDGKALLEAERERTRRLQAQEVNCTADELRTILRAERLRMEQHMLANTGNEHHNNNNPELLEAEVLVEGQLQGMMRHLDVLQEEKGRLAAEIQREEELMQTTLQARLAEVYRNNESLRRQIDEQWKVNEALKVSLSAQQSSRNHTEPDTGNRAPTDDSSVSQDSDVIMKDRME